MKVLVTGANGFVGTAVCKELSEQGVEVIAIVRHPDEVIRSIEKNNGIRIVYADLSNFRNLADLIPDRDVDILYHFVFGFYYLVRLFFLLTFELVFLVLPFI